MKKYVINGKFMTDRMQGIVRYAREMTKALDKCIDDKIEVTLLIPNDAKDIPDLQRIKIETIGTHTGMAWEQTDLRKYLKKHKDVTCINFCNICPFFVQPGITAIHDIMYKVNPQDYKTVRNKLSRYWHMVQYWYVARHEKAIITVSNFSKGEIEKYYPHTKGKITVIPNGWQHVLEYKESTDWQERYSFLKPKEYFFSLSTLSRNKNGKWIIENAKYNPNCVYAIAGKYYETDKFDIPENVHMLGFISDEDACVLIKNCRAFIHPALYEGFGLPPLEALALGAEVIASNVTSLPEVLGDCVHYIEPNDYHVNMNKAVQQTVADSSYALDRYGWEKSSKILADMMGY